MVPIVGTRGGHRILFLALTPTTGVGGFGTVSMRKKSCRTSSGGGVQVGRRQIRFLRDVMALWGSQRWRAPLLRLLAESRLDYTVAA